MGIDTKEETTEPEPKKVNKKAYVIKEIITYVLIIIMSVLAIKGINYLGISSVNVNGVSMAPTLQNGDKVLLSNVLYVPEIGDIIVFEAKGKNQLYVKRIIATGGQTVKIDTDNSHIYVDDKLLVDEFSQVPMTTEVTIETPVVVPENSYFVLGDNRNDSQDSRLETVGMVPRDSIKGSVKFRVWPIEKIGNVK